MIVFKFLQLRWHPDKNTENPELATAVFQFLQSQKDWYLKEWLPHDVAYKSDSQNSTNGCLYAASLKPLLKSVGINIASRREHISIAISEGDLKQHVGKVGRRKDMIWVSEV